MNSRSSRSNRFTSTAYDPHAPRRDPRSRRDGRACVADMARCMAEICATHGQEVVTEDDLLRAGFGPGEIERHRVDAAAALTEQLEPSRRAA